MWGKIVRLGWESMKYYKKPVFSEKTGFWRNFERGDLNGLSSNPSTCC